MQHQLYPVGALLAACLAGCATPHRQAIASQLTIVELPKLGDERTAEAGEAVVTKSRVYLYEAVRLENRISGGDGNFGKRFTLEPGLLEATVRDEKHIYYTTNKLAVFDSVSGTQFERGGLAVSILAPNDVKFYWNEEIRDAPKPAPVLAKTEAADGERPNFRRELIYNGRSGDTLRFTYREYSGELLSAQLIQMIQYNLKNGATFGYKGARVEVIEASPARIKYRLLAGFPDAP